MADADCDDDDEEAEAMRVERCSALRHGARLLVALLEKEPVEAASAIVAAGLWDRAAICVWLDALLRPSASQLTVSIENSTKGGLRVVETGVWARVRWSVFWSSPVRVVGTVQSPNRT